jgi:hypothetical protein
MTLLPASQPLAAQPAATGDLVIEGRAAQALHCAAMLFLLSATLYDAGELSRNTRDAAQRAALVMLDQVPGTEEQRRRAMVQRFARIMDSRSPDMLLDEYARTAEWCRRTFIG